MDHSATTRVSSHVAQVVLEMMTENYGNPSSLHHRGVLAQQALERARRQIASALGAREEEIIFTSGGTEANNLAIQGLARARRRRGDGLVTSGMEHSSVLGAVHHMEEEGFRAVLLAPGPDGRIQPESVATAVDEKTLLVSCMLVNNETGAVNPIGEISAAAKAKNPDVVIHCDAVQAFGKLPIDVRRLGVDLMTVSGHKIHAPKGVGALYVKKGIRLVPLVYGGSQERALRPGTENVPLACGFGAAAEDMLRGMAENTARFEALRRRLISGAEKIEGVCINSAPGGAPYIVNLSCPGIRSEIMLHFLEGRGIYVSSGSACSKGAKSHVLAAMGLGQERIDSALRVSFCRESTEEEVDRLLEGLAAGIAMLEKNRGRQR